MSERVTLDFEALLAVAVQRLVKLDHLDAALALAEATIVRIPTYNDNTVAEVYLAVPGDQYDSLTTPEVYAYDEDVDGWGNTYSVEGSSVLCRVFTDVLPNRMRCSKVEVKVRNDPVPESWRSDFKASVGRGPVNQGNVPGVPAGKFILKDGLRYRSMTEIKFADELKRRDILFFPLPVAVINGVPSREPDFLVLHAGRVGVVEIHGEPWHPASRAAEDHAKSLPYRLRGAEHLIVDSKEAYETPEKVVDKILRLLEGPKP